MRINNFSKLFYFLFFSKLFSGYSSKKQKCEDIWLTRLTEEYMLSAWDIVVWNKEKSKVIPRFITRRYKFEINPKFMYVHIEN